MSDQNLDNVGAGNAPRPTFLTVLCILSFISAGISIIMLILGALVVGAVEVGVAGAEANGAVVESQTGNVWMFLIVAVVLTIVSLVGVIKMWKLQKQGFYIYTGASVASMIATAVMSTFSVVGLIFPIAFIVMYYLNLKDMK